VRTKPQQVNLGSDAQASKEAQDCQFAPLLVRHHFPHAHHNAIDASINMVKFYETSFSYDYSFPAVTLAYFLRYPNPYSTHVLSTDVIDRHHDPETGRLSTTRIHLKRSRLPPAILKLLPKSVLGNVSAGSSSSYILETSTIDVKEGWMKTESRNLDWTGILSVVEKQTYHKNAEVDARARMDEMQKGGTNVTTTVIFRSRLGDRIRARARRGEDAYHASVEEEPKKGLLASWSTSGLQRSIEAIASRRTTDQMGKAKEGMTVVLERLRSGGLVEVLDGMRRDREAAFGPDGPFKRALASGDDED
jgi:4-amino-4-deoxychorismate lyase